MDRVANSGAARGYSLVELLVALAVLALLMTTIYDGFRYANGIQSRTIALSQNHHDVAHAQDFLRDLIASTTGGVRPLSGETDALRFIAPLRRHGLPDGLYEVTLRLQESPTGGRLVIDWKKLTVAKSEAGGRAAGAGTVTVVDDVSDLSIAYFGDGANAIWLSRWSSKESSPRLVRIALSLSGGYPWPDLLVSPRATRDANCVFDPVSRNCRQR